jgi:hypothetical protein
MAMAHHVAVEAAQNLVVAYGLLKVWIILPRPGEVSLAVVAVRLHVHAVDALRRLAALSCALNLVGLN